MVDDRQDLDARGIRQFRVKSSESTSARKSTFPASFTLRFFAAQGQEA